MLSKAATKKKTKTTNKRASVVSSSCRCTRFCTHKVHSKEDTGQSNGIAVGSIIFSINQFD